MYESICALDILVPIVVSGVSTVSRTHRVTQLSGQQRFYSVTQGVIFRASKTYRCSWYRAYRRSVWEFVSFWSDS